MPYFPNELSPFPPVLFPAFSAYTLCQPGFPPVFLHHKAFVIFHMIVTAQVQHTVCHQERQFALLRMTVFLRLLVYLIDRDHDIAQKKFARFRVKIVL